MKTPLFEVKITAYGDTETGAGSNCVHIIGRHGKHDGEQVGELHDCTLDEAIEFTRGSVTAFMKGTQA